MLKKSLANCLLTIALSLFTLPYFWLPLIGLIAMEQINQPLLTLITFSKFLLLFVLFITLPMLLRLKTFGRSLLALIVGGYYGLVYFFIAYNFFTYNKFDPFFVLDAYQDVFATMFAIFPHIFWNYLIFLLVMLIIFTAVSFFILGGFLNRYLTEKKITLPNFGRHLALLLIIFLFLPPNNGYLTNQIKNFYLNYFARKYFQAYQPDNRQLTTKSRDNIFILQLESSNSLALLGETQELSSIYRHVYVPELLKLTKFGVFFPYLWANSVTTDQAQANLLCGVSGNIGFPFSYHLADLTAQCLPELLKQSGYTTVVFRSDDLWFHHMGNYLKRLGYDEVHHRDIMQPGDREYQWGFDDCIFYQRAFEYLKKNYPDRSRLMVYFEPSSTHIPFNPKEGYEAVKLFTNPNNLTEKYFNSILEQDHCLATFYQEFQAYQNGRTHLFILADHSMPVGVNYSSGNFFGLQGDRNENFLTYLFYLPPDYRQNEFAIDKKVADSKKYGQTDLLPTIFELLNGQNYPNSFAGELFKNGQIGAYEDCHLSAQPYGGGRLVVIKGKDKYIYSLTEKKLTHYDIGNDFWETRPEIIYDLPFKDFRERYYCPRFR